MKKLVIILLFFSFSGFLSLAQKQSFMIYDFTGNVSIKEKAVENPVKRNMFLKNASVLVLKEKSSVLILRENDGMPVNIKESGSYTLKKLIELADAGKPNVTGWFLEFCMDEIIKVHDEALNKGKGVVSRGHIDNLPMLLPPDSSLIIKNAITFIWTLYPGNKPLYFIITDTLYNEVFKKKITDTSISIVPLSCNMKAGKTYFWSVSTKEKASAAEMWYSFKLSSDENTALINKKLDDFKRLINYGEETNLFLLAVFLQNMKLYNEAYETYKAAIKLYPENSSIKSNYKDFLNKTGL